MWAPFQKTLHYIASIFTGYCWLVNKPNNALVKTLLVLDYVISVKLNSIASIFSFLVLTKDKPTDIIPAHTSSYQLMLAHTSSYQLFAQLWARRATLRCSWPWAIGRRPDMVLEYTWTRLSCTYVHLVLLIRAMWIFKWCYLLLLQWWYICWSIAQGRWCCISSLLTAQWLLVLLSGLWPKVTYSMA